MHLNDVWSALKPCHCVCHWLQCWETVFGWLCTDNVLTDCTAGELYLKCEWRRREKMEEREGEWRRGRVSGGVGECECEWSWREIRMWGIGKGRQNNCGNFRKATIYLHSIKEWEVKSLRGNDCKNRDKMKCTQYMYSLYICMGIGTGYMYMYTTCSYMYMWTCLDGDLKGVKITKWDNKLET